MAGKRRRAGKPGAATPSRTALGNDPFVRGAAPRVVAAAPPPPPPPSPAPAPAPTPSARALDVLGLLEARLDAAIEAAEARLASAAGGGGQAVASARDEVRAVVAALWPAVRARLASAGDLLRLLEPPERLDRHGMDPRLVARATPVVEALYASWWRVDVRGLEHVPAAGPVVVVANHAGLLPWDALVLRHALRRDHPARRELRPLLDDAACDRPASGPLAIRLGAVRASPEAAARILAAGDLVGVFPEGSSAEARPWRERYRLGAFGRGGFVKVALRAGAPVVPCAIVGSEEAAPAISRAGWLADLLRLPPRPSLRVAWLGQLPLPSRWSLRFGPAIDLGGAGPAAAEDAPLVAGASARTRAALQAMLDEAVASRTSVYL